MTDLALPAYLASLRSSVSLTAAVYPHAANICQPDTSLLRLWSKKTGIDPPEELQQGRQRAWDRAAAGAVASRLLKDSPSDTNSARLRAASQPHSGAWLNVLPVASLGTLLDRETLRTAVALRVGAPACALHRCRCGATVDSRGLHALSCQLSAGRLPRHAALNDTVKRALLSAGMPSILEPAGLDRGDGRRPDGMTTFPFSSGRCLIWDSTCVDTYADYVIHKSATQAGSAAQAAENRKQRRYAELGRRFQFQPIAVETSGSLGQSTLPFLKELGRRIARETGDTREVEYIFQRVSLAVVRGNATSLLMGSTANAVPELRRSKSSPDSGAEVTCPTEPTTTPARPDTEPASSNHSKSVLLSGVAPVTSSANLSHHSPQEVGQNLPSAAEDRCGRAAESEGCPPPVKSGTHPSRNPLDDPELARYLMPTTQDLTDQLLCITPSSTQTPCPPRPMALAGYAALLAEMKKGT